MLTELEEHRFLCDRMLERLARYLRAAGYDTATAEASATDQAIVRRIERESRILLTCDRDLVERANARGAVVLLPGDGLDAAAIALGKRVGLNWLIAPFSRCLIDNTKVIPAGPQERPRLPPRAREIGGIVMRCPACGRLYWPGSHVRRMQARLERWRQQSGGAA